MRPVTPIFAYMKIQVLNDHPGPCCLECGAPLIYGRPDRKFCNEDCKNRYHNRISNRERSGKRRVLNALNRNHEILSGLLRFGVTALDMDELLLQGFHPEFFTSCRRCGRTSVYGCFDISFEMTPSGISGIRRGGNLP